MSNHEDKVKVVISAVNQTRIEINKWKPALVQAFTPLIGKKVIKTDRSLTKIALEVIPADLPANDKVGTHFYHLHQKHLLSFVAKTMNVKELVVGSYKESFDVGYIINGTLVKVCSDLTSLKCDYTFEHVVSVNQKIKEYENLIAILRDSIEPVTKAIFWTS